MQSFHPIPNQWLSFPQHTLIWVQKGTGVLEVDFQAYPQVKDRLIYLSPHQPIKFLGDHFEGMRLDFPATYVSRSPDYRVLFKHLVSLGYVALSEENRKLLDSLSSADLLRILEESSHQWYWQNPFSAQKEEYRLIFDLKEVIDQHFRDNWTVPQLVAEVEPGHYPLPRLIHQRLGISIKWMAQHKRLLESKREIAFTDKSIQAVAYELGFKDPAYFGRFFRSQTQLSPGAFRAKYGTGEDGFVQDLLALIQQHHPRQHQTAFYADQLHISPKALARKVQTRLNLTVGELIRAELIKSAQARLGQLPVKEVAYELGFSEANHFSAFFKRYTGLTPSAFLEKKYQN